MNLWPLIEKFSTLHIPYPRLPFLGKLSAQVVLEDEQTATKEFTVAALELYRAQVQQATKDVVFATDKGTRALALLTLANLIASKDAAFREDPRYQERAAELRLEAAEELRKLE